MSDLERVALHRSSMSHLPWDLQKEILSRIPLTSLRSVRSTCKKWNILFKDGSSTKKHLAREGEFVAIVTINYSIYLMSINLYGIHNNSEPSIKPTGKLITLNDSDEVGISQLCHCEGLLLCTTKDYTRLVVWNPYSGQTVFVKPTSVHHEGCWYGHALGYDKSKSCRTNKILRSAHPCGGTSVHEIYDLNSNSWRFLDVTPDRPVGYDNNGRSLKGNTYWIAPDKESRKDDLLDVLLCFDFTKERFGPHLPLPFMVCYDNTVILSSLREEQLAVSVQRWENCVMEIWVTTKIEPNAVSWSKFFAVDMSQFTNFRFYPIGSFLVDEEKRTVVVFDENRYYWKIGRNSAYIIGENGYFRQVDLGEITDEQGFPLACSFVPSSVQISNLHENQIY